tara:strand:- start:310 stop:501 length:192 start_codon:yes stop_codon:yes gene_type:complete
MIEVHYLMTTADEKEVELFVENKPKELMKYGFKNEKLWTMFLDKDDTVSIEEIEEAMSLASNL